MNGLHRQIVRGEPLRVGDHEVIPEAQVWSLEFKQAAVSDKQMSGGGFHWSWARPTALIDRSDGEERRIPVIDWNLRLEMLLLLAAISLPVILLALPALARQLLKRRAQSFRVEGG